MRDRGREARSKSSLTHSPWIIDLFLGYQQGSGSYEGQTPTAAEQPVTGYSVARNLNRSVSKLSGAKSNHVYDLFP